MVILYFFKKFKIARFNQEELIKKSKLKIWLATLYALNIPVIIKKKDFNYSIKKNRT